MTQGEARALVKKHGGVRAAARAVGLAYSTFADLLAGKGSGKPRNARLSESGGRTLADFRQAYDKDTIVPAKIKVALARLGPDAWEYEVAFAKTAGVSLADLNAYREQFAAFWMQVKGDGRKVWAGSVKLAKQMREIVT